MLSIIEKKGVIKYIQILPFATEGGTEIIGEGFHYYFFSWK